MVEKRAARALLDPQFAHLEPLPEKLRVPADPRFRAHGGSGKCLAPGSTRPRPAAGPGLELQDAKEHPSHGLPRLVPVFGACGDKMTNTETGFLLLGNVLEGLGRVQFVAWA